MLVTTHELVVSAIAALCPNNFLFTSLRSTIWIVSSIFRAYSLTLANSTVRFLIEALPSDIASLIGAVVAVNASNNDPIEFHSRLDFSVVDDSVSIRQMVRFTLQRAGHDVVEAVDGEDALTKIKKHELIWY